MVERKCAIAGCTGCMSDGGVKYCAAHTRATGFDTRRRATTFHFKCAGCPFEAILPSKKKNRVYCDDCAEERERNASRDRGRRQRERAKANAGAQGAPQAHGAEAIQANGHSAVRCVAGVLGQVRDEESSAAE